jgi:hypothetical protein
MLQKCTKFHVLFKFTTLKTIISTLTGMKINIQISVLDDKKLRTCMNCIPQYPSGAVRCCYQPKLEEMAEDLGHTYTLALLSPLYSLPGLFF